jgi:BMFP domain-containing protein YqiC
MGVSGDGTRGAVAKARKDLDDLRGRIREEEARLADLERERAEVSDGGPAR